MPLKLIKNALIINAHQIYVLGSLFNIIIGMVLVSDALNLLLSW